MAFLGDACRVDDDCGAVGCFGLLRAWVIWTLQLNGFPKVGQAEKKEQGKAGESLFSTLLKAFTCTTHRDYRFQINQLVELAS